MCNLIPVTLKPLCDYTPCVIKFSNATLLKCVCACMRYNCRNFLVCVCVCLRERDGAREGNRESRSGSRKEWGSFVPVRVNMINFIWPDLLKQIQYTCLLATYTAVPVVLSLCACLLMCISLWVCVMACGVHVHFSVCLFVCVRVCLSVYLCRR